METRNLPAIRALRPAWNKGRIVGQKRPLKPKHVWAIRVRLELAENYRDLALFNLAIDSKLRGCDLVRMKVVDGKTYLHNPSGKRPAELYIFAWHEGEDQRVASEWQFYVVQSSRLPAQQKSIGLGAIGELTMAVSAEELPRLISSM